MARFGGSFAFVVGAGRHEVALAAEGYDSLRIPAFNLGARGTVHVSATLQRSQSSPTAGGTVRASCAARDPAAPQAKFPLTAVNGILQPDAPLDLTGMTIHAYRGVCASGRGLAVWL